MKGFHFTDIAMLNKCLVTGAIKYSAPVSSLEGGWKRGGGREGGRGGERERERERGGERVCVCVYDFSVIVGDS